MGDWACSVPTSSLLCHEDHSLFDADDDDDHRRAIIAHDHSKAFGPEDEYIEILVSQEIGRLDTIHFAAFHAENSWLKWARSDAIQWMMKTKACFGFSDETAYLAVTYYDRFLMRRSIEKGKPWVVQLLSVGCLSLAAKMEECIVPALSEYQTEGCKFDGNTMQRMELLILSTLEWKMNSITPFAFLSYFASKFQLIDHQSREFLSECVGLIFDIIDDINLVENRASTVAAAAVLAASNRRLDKRLVESKLSIFSALESEQVFACYTMMTEESRDKDLTSRNNKRRRLQLDNDLEKSP